METKICNICCINKNITEFAIRNEKTQNRSKRCKQCANDYAKQYRNSNKSIIQERQSNWYNTKGKTWKKNYTETNRDKINQYDRIRYKTNNQYRMKKS